MTDFDLTAEERLKREVNREQQAEAVLKNPVFNQFFIEYRAQLVDSIIRSEGDAVNKREEFYRQLKSLGIMEAKLISAIQTGKMARDELSRLQKIAKAAKDMIG